MNLLELKRRVDDLVETNNRHHPEWNQIIPVAVRICPPPRKPRQHFKPLELHLIDFIPCCMINGSHMKIADGEPESVFEIWADNKKIWRK